MVVLVTGAGSSMESPTDFQSGAHYSRRAYDRLVMDGVIAESDCADPSDLSALAEAVFVKTGTQKELTDRLPQAEWRSPNPNAGHYLAAALLVEGALRHIVTLNFDLAFQIALSTMGRPDAIAIIKGPEESNHASSRSLTYLHRSAEADPETWVLRTSALDTDWRDHWEEAVAQSHLTAPHVVFAGLGSPAAVLTESAHKLSRATGNSYYLADPYPENKFAEALGSTVSTFTYGWVELITELSRRVVRGQVADWTEAATVLAKEHGIDESIISAVLEPIAQLDLKRLGELRAAWVNSGTYQADVGAIQRRQLSDIVLAIGRLVAQSAGSVVVDDAGLVTIRASSRQPVSLGAMHGAGTFGIVQLEQSIASRLDRVPDHRRPRWYVLAGARSGGTPLPPNIVRAVDSSSIVRGRTIIRYLAAEDIMSADSNQLTQILEELQE